jgi:hypothetical protein
LPPLLPPDETPWRFHLPQARLRRSIACRFCRTASVDLPVRQATSSSDTRPNSATSAFVHHGPWYPLGR